MAEERRPPSVPEAARWADDLNEWELGSVDAEGRRDGIVRTWRLDGTPASEGTFRAGVPHGPFRRFHPDGSLAREGQFIDGRPHGTVVAHGHEQPTPEPMQSCCVPPGAWRLEIDFQNGSPAANRWYDRAGVHILQSGAPHPPRPASVPAAAFFEESQERWVQSGGFAGGEVDGVWLRWSTEGVLRERDDYRAGKPHGTWQRFDERGDVVEESHWADGVRDGPCRRVGLQPGIYADARVHEERGAFVRGQAVGPWSLHDRDGETVRRFELGVAVDEEALRASPALGAPERARADWEAQAEALEGEGRLGEAILAAARAAAVARDADPLRLLLARITPALTAEAALDLASTAVGRAEGKLAPLANMLVRGADPAALLRALASSLMGDDRVALDLIEAALLLAPERDDCRLTRALIHVHLGHPEAARADAARLPDEQRAFLDSYIRVTFPRFDFWPAAADIRTLFPDVPPGPEQPVEKVRTMVQKYATRLQAIRAAVAARLDGRGARPDWLPPDLSALLPEGPHTLDVWEFEEVVVDDDGQPPAGAPAPQPTQVKVDERLSLDDGYTVPALMRLARRDWNAVCWLCWSAGLDRVALPEAVTPPAAFGQAAAMSVERLWRCRDKLATGGLRAMSQKLPGFTWEGMDIDAMPPILAEIAADEHAEMRALFYWLCDEGVQSPWQDNLRGND